MNKAYRRLRLEERERIAVLRGWGMSVREIAKNLGRDASTISREIRRNGCVIAKRRCYLVHRAEMRSRRKAALRGKRPRLKKPEIREYVVQKLKLHWSPEQIAGRLSMDHPEFQISYKAIYEFVYEEAMELVVYLPRKHKRRRLRLRRSVPSRFLIPQRIFLDERPDKINTREEFGHWEADCAVSRQSLACLHILLERKTRLLKITKLRRLSSVRVRQAILWRLGCQPKLTRLSLTYDNGHENIDHLEVNRALEMQSYFCHPYASWEKGAVENGIGLIRRFLPKKTDFEKIPSGEIRRIEKLLNTRPRKCLQYRTPREVFSQFADALTGSM